jgi:hypothetical protein
MDQSLPPGSSLPPPGHYGVPTVDGVPVRPDSSRVTVALLTAVGSALGLIAWLYRTFAGSGQQRKLWTGSWRIDFPLILVAVGLVAALALGLASHPIGPGLAAGILIATLPILTGGVAPTRTYTVGRAAGALAILATGLAIVGALRAGGNERVIGAKAILPACLALALLVLGQAAAAKVIFASFDTACFVGVAIGVALANRVGWSIATGALLFHATRGVLSYSSSSSGGRFDTPFRPAELLCGVVLLVVCAVFAMLPSSSRTVE